MVEKQNITIYDIAKAANVSMATVSRVVNGNQNVKSKTRKQVLKVINDFHYRPNAVARGLASKRSTTVGMIIPNVTNTYFSTLARGIDDIAAMYNYNIILTNSDGNPERENKAINTLLAKQVDGIIFMGNQLSDSVRNSLVNSQTPVVLAGSVDENSEIPNVNIDYRKAVYAVMNQLLANGDDRIAFVSGSLERSINRKFRLEGYKDALKDAGINFEKKLVFQSEVDYQSGYQLAKRLEKENVQAAVVSDDELACGIMNAYTDAGVSVPNEFELATSNDTKLCEMTRPQLSTITQPLYDVGAVSMRMLTKLMKNEPVDENNVLLPFGLKKRQSTR